MSENSNTSNVQLPGIINNILGQWADDIIERVNESARFLGVTTTEITDGSTVSTIVIDSESVSVSTGDIAVYSGNYFLFYSSAWHAGGGGGGPSSIDAEDVSYDNTTSGLTATNVQDAIDNVADIITPFGFDKLKTQTFTGLTVPANFIDTRDLTLSVPAELGILSGFALAGTSNCSVIQCYFTNRTTLHTRVLNLASQQDSYSFVVFYI